MIITRIDIESGEEGEQADCDDEDMYLLDELGKYSKSQKEVLKKTGCQLLFIWLPSQFLHNVFLMM